jgi:glycosyltransferase involved in cell wall biosynthesis
MESEDDTVALAEELGARVISVPRAGFAEPGRQRGIESASFPWVLVLDVDEVATPGMLEQVRCAVERDDLAGLRFPRLNYLFGRPMLHGAVWPDFQLRLFRRDATIWPPYVHTQAEVSGAVEDAPARPDVAILHRSWSRLGEWMSAADRYSDLEVDRQLALGRRASAVRLVLAPPWRFFDSYVRRGGFRDGRHGLAIALLALCYTILLELKFWERTIPPSA